MILMRPHLGPTSPARAPVLDRSRADAFAEVLGEAGDAHPVGASAIAAILVKVTDAAPPTRAGQFSSPLTAATNLGAVISLPGPPSAPRATTPNATKTGGAHPVPGRTGPRTAHRVSRRAPGMSQAPERSSSRLTAGVARATPTPAFARIAQPDPGHAADGRAADGIGSVYAPRLPASAVFRSVRAQEVTTRADTTFAPQRGDETSASRERSFVTAQHDVGAQRANPAHGPAAHVTAPVSAPSGKRWPTLPGTVEVGRDKVAPTEDDLQPAAVSMRAPDRVRLGALSGAIVPGSKADNGARPVDAVAEPAGLSRKPMHVADRHAPGDARSPPPVSSDASRFEERAPAQALLSARPSANAPASPADVLAGTDVAASGTRGATASMSAVRPSIPNPHRATTQASPKAHIASPGACLTSLALAPASTPASPARDLPGSGEATDRSSSLDLSIARAPGGSADAPAAGTGPSGSAQLHLHPAALGPLNIDLALDRDTVSVAVTTATPAAHAMVGEARNELARALDHAGLGLGGLSVALGQQEHHSGAPSHRPAGHGAAFTGERATSATSVGTTAGAAATAALVRAVFTHEGRVNVYA